MADDKFRYLRHAEKTAALKWKRMYIRGRERDLLEGLTDLDMPVWKKRRLIRDVIHYSSVSSYQPLQSLSVYDYEPEAERTSDAVSYGFCKSSSDGSFTEAVTSTETMTSDTDKSERVTTTTSRFSEPVNSLPAETVNEEVDDDSTSQQTELVSPLNEEEFEATVEWIASEQNSPDRTKKSEDTEILSLSPALSALKITRESSQILEAEVRIKDAGQNSNVSFFKCGNLHTYLTNESQCDYEGECSISKETSSEPVDRAEAAAPRLLLVPSNLRPKIQRLVQNFAEHFDCRILECEASEGSFDERVSHVIIDLGLPNPLEFVHYQAIGCKRFLISEEWLQACLEAGRIVSEDPHELMFCDEETGACLAEPASLARLSPNNLFDGFAIIMCRPFVDFKESLVMQLLSMNGARVCTHPRELNDVPGQARFCIVDPECYRTGKQRELLKLKSMKYKFVVVQYKWLFDSLILYQVQPLSQYLHDANIQLALEVGVPFELLKE